MTTLPFVWTSASATGAGHRAKSEPSQDSHRLASFVDASGVPWIVAVVADGAGSAEHGGIGSEVAAEIFIEAIQHGVEDGILTDLKTLVESALILARCELEIWAETFDCAVGDLATTFCGFVSNGSTHGFIQIGDGIMVAGPPWAAMLSPQVGTFASETVFLTCVVSEPLSTVVLMTDGLRDLVVTYGTWEAKPEFFDFVLGGLATADEAGSFTALSERLQGFLEGESVRSRTADDTTLIAIHFRTGASP
jgi:Protein phosphatase 2C